jgi:hypothetical protein
LVDADAGDVLSGTRGDGNVELSLTSDQASPPVQGSAPAKSKRSGTLDDFVVELNPVFKARAHQLVARFVFHTGIPFDAIEHETFDELMGHLHPGYHPPSRRSLPEKYLKDEYDATKDRVKQAVKDGEHFVVSEDYWTDRT